MRKASLAAAAVLLFACLTLPTARAQAPTIDPVSVHVFYRAPIQFDPNNPSRFDTTEITAADNGREIMRTLALPRLDHEIKILARVTAQPIPKDASSVHDPWDRAGNVCLLIPGQPAVEVVKFITAYGGRTTHEVDVTYLAPLLVGECTFRGFVDTWVSPAWEMSFELVFEPAGHEEPPAWMQEWLEEEDLGVPDWCIPLAYESLNRAQLDRGDVLATVTVPADAQRIVLHYLVSGHCTDGRGADEFEPKDNVILVDGREVQRFRPWRDDCRQFRDVNPYCRRWFDGSWSADFSRSGWCPGDVVLPRKIDLSNHLAAGEHTVGFRIDDVRPKDDSGEGYWRMSAVLVGWRAGR